MALIGVGHLVGMAVGIAMLVGLIISWFVLVPWQTGLAGLGSAADIETLVGSRFPRESALHRRRHHRRRRDLDPAPDHGPDHHAASPRRIAASRARRAGGQDSLALTERDIPIGIIAGGILLALIPIGLAAVRLRAKRADRRRACRDDRP